MKKSRKKHPLAINGMHHVSLRVHDMERSLAFYREILGFSPKTSFLLDGLRFAMLETGNNVYIETRGNEAADAVGRRKRSVLAPCVAHRSSREIAGDFFGEYTNARMIIDLGERHEKKPQSQQPNP